MNILFFTYDFPYPTNSGGKTRAYNLLKFAKGNNKIILFSFIREAVTDAQKNELKAIGVDTIITFQRKPVKDLQHISSFISKTHSIFYSLYFDRNIEKKLIEYIQVEKIDIIHFESFYTAFYVSSHVKNLGVKLIYGSENIEYKLYEAYTNQHVFFPLRIPFIREVKKIQREEETLYKNVDACLAVTENESELISKFNKNSYTIPNGVDLTYFTFAKKEEKQEKNILFVGNFSYFPNVEAVRFFYFNVFKKMSDESLRFVIIGKHFEKTKLSIDTRIIHKEFVEDIHETYVSATIFVSPVSIGGGTNFKILEAMASGTPVIALKETGLSIGAKNEQEILLSSKEHFLSETNRIVSNISLQQTLAKNGRIFIEENYSWHMIGKKLQSVWNEVGKQ